MVDTVFIGLIGCGTVGGGSEEFPSNDIGVYEILKNQHDRLLNRYGKEYIIKMVLLTK